MQSARFELNYVTPVRDDSTTWSCYSRENVIPDHTCKLSQVIQNPRLTCKMQFKCLVSLTYFPSMVSDGIAQPHTHTHMHHQPSHTPSGGKERVPCTLNYSDMIHRLLSLFSHNFQFKMILHLINTMPWATLLSILLHP